MRTKLYLHTHQQLADLDTPMSIYLKLSVTPRFLLESVEASRYTGRYSIIGLDPFISLRTPTESPTETTVCTHPLDNTPSKTTIHEGNPIDLLQSTLNQYAIDNHEDCPDIIGGAFGLFGWDIIRQIEPKAYAPAKKIETPLMHMIIPRSLILFDHARRTLMVLSLATSALCEHAKARIQDIRDAIASPTPHAPLPLTKPDPEAILNNVHTSMPKSVFLSHIDTVNQHIRDGDVFQLVLSQSFSLTTKKSSTDIYRSLRYINPSPYMYLFNFDDYDLIGSSPEILVTLTGNTATLKPIAGTRNRGANLDDDRLKAALTNDPKERAEHLMLIDLARNDLGRVCTYDSIQVSSFMAIETYSHVHHMVSTICGQLRPHVSAFDLLKATFPAGTLSGAPKVRAVEIIYELEPHNRQFYGGACGYIGFNGRMDLCIIIRTLLKQGNRCTVQAGAGLVADSDPEREYRESQQKALGALSACY